MLADEGVREVSSLRSKGSKRSKRRRDEGREGRGADAPRTGVLLESKSQIFTVI